MSIWKTITSCEQLNHRFQNSLVAHLEISFIVIGNDFITASMPVKPFTKQSMGILHGGASCVIAETVGSTAGNLCVHFPEEYCVGLEININHLKPKESGTLFATARPFHIGKRTHVWSIELRDEKEELIAISRHTVMVINSNSQK